MGYRIKPFIYAVVAALLIAPLMPSAAGAETVRLGEGQTSVDAGTLYTDAPVRHEFELLNGGDAPVTGLKLEASCGCTVVEVFKNALQPGESATVKVSTDPIGKSGPISKKIYIEYLYGGKSRLMVYEIRMLIRAKVEGHGTSEAFGTTEAGEAAAIRDMGGKLFGAKCAGCHAAPAEGKTGDELFKAVCGHCHGQNAQGATAAGFNRLDWLKAYDRSQSERVIREGRRGTGGVMPGFSKSHGGPLSDEQVESLLKFFDDKREQSKIYFR
jgi:mono/diheme cytochrome c family protein